MWWLVLSALAAPMETCLENGLRVVVEERPGRPVLGVSMAISGGSSGEDRAATGVAHLVEHLWFRHETEDGDVHATLQKMGADYNAVTWQDTTTYATVLHRRTLRAALALEADRLTDPLAGVTPEILEIERAVVQQEWALRMGGASRPLNVLFDAVLPADHPYAGRVHENLDSWGALGMDAVRAYAEAWYRPEHATLSVIGALPLELVLKEIGAAFGAGSTEVVCPTHLPDTQVPAPPARTEIPVHTGMVDGPTVAVLWSYPTRFDGLDEATAYLVSTQLPGNGSCRVQQQPRLSLFQCHLPQRDRDKDIRTIIRTTQRTFKNASDHQLNAHADLLWHHNRWTRMKKLTDPGWRQRLDASPSGLLASLAESYHLYGDDTGLGQNNTSVRRVAEFGRTLISPERARAVVLVPPKDSGSAGAIAHGNRRAPPPEAEADLATLERVVVGPDIDDVHTFTLANGTHVWAMRSPQSGPEGYAKAIFPVDPTLSAHPLLGLIGTGFVETSASVRGFVLDAFYANGGWHTWSHQMHGRWELSVVGGTPGQGLSVLTGILAEQPSVHPSKVLRKTIRRTRDQQERKADAMVRRVALAHWNHLAPGQPHPTYDVEGIAALEELDYRTVKEVARRILHPTNTTVLLLSSSDPHSADEAVRVSPLSTWSAPPRPVAPESVAWPEPASRETLLFADPSLTAQARLALSCHVGGTPLASELTQRLLAARLQETLRHALGATYAVHTTERTEAHGRTMVIETSVGTPRSGRAAAEVFEAIRAVTQGDLAPGELDRLKLSYARGTVTRWQSVPEQAEWLSQLAASGLPPESEANLAQRLHELTAADLAQALQPCAGREILTIRGEPKGIAAALDEAGLSYEAR